MQQRGVGPLAVIVLVEINAHLQGAVVHGTDRVLIIKLCCLKTIEEYCVNCWVGRKMCSESGKILLPSDVPLSFFTEAHHREAMK